MTPPKDKATTVEQYRSKVAEPRKVTLPSGAVVTIRTLTPMDYIKEGLEDIPNEFLSFVAELQAGIPNNKRTMEDEKKNYELFEKFMNITLSRGVIEPLICLRYDKGKIDTHLVYSELTGDDQKALVDAIMGKA